MQIISLTRRRGQLFCVTLDDGREILLDKQTVEESPFGEGSTIEEAALNDLIEASERRRAREYAVYLLSLRDYSGMELRRKLREKGHGTYAEQTVAQLTERNFLNDAVYARRLARECRVRKLFARRRTVQELYQHGIDRETAALAVDEVDDAENITDFEQALALLQKKRYNTSVNESEHRRGVALLQRYGYDHHVIREAWRGLSGDSEFFETGE